MKASGNGTAIYVGDVTAPRGIEDAVAACREAEIDLVIVGRISEALARLMRGVKDDEGSELSITGPVSHPDAMDRVSAASVGLSPLRDEPNYRASLPTKTLEYLALGVPVVATALPGTKAILDGLEAVWLVPPGDIPAMTSALREAVRPGAKTAAVEQAPSVRDRFGWPEVEVRSFYARLLGPQGTQDPS
jgi:glycosyltransferase involved in cell wall biosynthesis